MSGVQPRIAREGALLDILLDDGDNGNLVSNEAGAAIAAALAGLDEGAKLVRIRATGRAFCLGRVSPMPPPGAKPTAAQLRARVAEPPLALYGAIRACPVPVLAVVQGAAHGYGCAIVAAADLAIAADAAAFAVPEMERDIPPLLVMTAFAGRVGHKAAMHLALDTREITAEAARAAGILGAVVPAAFLEAEAARLTERLLGYGVPALRAMKTFLAASPSLPPEAAAALAANLAATALSARFA